MPSNITALGVEKVVIYGIPDWVYEGTALCHFIFYNNRIILEEVLASNYAMWWAPDGEHILYAVFNDSVVRDFNFPYYGDPSNAYTDIISIAYPKVSCCINVSGTSRQCFLKNSFGNEFSLTIGEKFVKLPNKLKI